MSKIYQSVKMTKIDIFKTLMNVTVLLRQIKSQTGPKKMFQIRKTKQFLLNLTIRMF